jgi:putative tricarboxylic transport membrane protein
VLWHVQSFPAMPGQHFGPALFPGLIAAGLAACGVALVFRGLRSNDPWLSLGAWVRRSRPLAGFISVLGGLALYVVLAEPLGFHLTGFLLVLAWTLVFGARPALAVSVAIAAPLLIHLAFYKLLRVPLPWGVLERLAF